MRKIIANKNKMNSLQTFPKDDDIRGQMAVHEYLLLMKWEKH